MSLGLTHPDMVRRWERLCHLAWGQGWELWIEASTRDTATQADLYRRWLAGTYDVPSVANPWLVGSESPWGWRVVGSYHQPQADGYSHALDIGWRGASTEDFHRLAVQCGLVPVLSNERWHFQWWQGATIFPTDLPRRRPQEDTTMVITPTLRPGRPADQAPVLDFTQLPAEGAGFGFLVASTLYVRRPAAGMGPTKVAIYQAGVDDVGWRDLPLDGTAIAVTVTRSGLCSILGDAPGAVPVAEAWVDRWFVG